LDTGTQGCETADMSTNNTETELAPNAPLNQLSSKPPSKSHVEMTQLILPSDTNALGTAFGGKIMQWIDIAAAVCASRHCGRISVTASIDSLCFVKPMHVGDIVTLFASINHAWTSSMEIGVRVECEKAATMSRHHTASAYLTFVCIDDTGATRSVPKVEATTDNERRRMRDAELRRKHRLEIRQKTKQKIPPK